MLDAIARSDGTRASVTREVFRTRVEDGILGDIRFDRNGDLVDAPFTFFRIVAGWRVGWAYPVLVGLSFAYLYLRIGRRVPVAA